MALFINDISNMVAMSGISLTSVAALIWALSGSGGIPGKML
jgi:hypothetical protein